MEHKVDVFVPVLLNKEHQIVVVPVEGETLHVEQGEHVRKARVAYRENLLFDFLVRSNEAHPKKPGAEGVLFIVCLYRLAACVLQLLRELAKLGEKKNVGVCLFQRQLPVEPGELDLLIRDVDPCVGDPGVSISRTHARKGAPVFCASGFQDHDLPPGWAKNKHLPLFGKCFLVCCYCIGICSSHLDWSLPV